MGSAISATAGSLLRPASGFLATAALLAVAVLVPTALAAQNSRSAGSVLNGSGMASVSLYHSTDGLGLPPRLPGQGLLVFQDTVLSKTRMFVGMSGIALLTHLPMWGLALHRDLGGDQGITNRVPIALAAAGSATAVAWAAQRKDARFSTALAGSALGAGAAWWWASRDWKQRGLAPLLGVLAVPMVHGGLVAVSARR